MPLLRLLGNQLPVISYLTMVNVSGTAFSFTNLIMLWIGAAPSPLNT
jgi:hypothetical protein